ncbi:MAG: metallophosphoesterase [Gammaproteobacteria bacterium]|nr:metallophosphoesterase [Gammaproteobacteria bacterium]
MLDIAMSFMPDSSVLYLLTSSSVGMTFMLFVIAVFYDLSATAAKRVKFDNSRRHAIRVLFDVTMLVAAFAYLLRGFSNGIKFPTVKQVKVKLKDFPFDRYSIVQLTDVHVGRTIQRNFITKLVERTNELKPDMVVITGDLVDLPVNQIEYDLYPLKDLNAPVYFILGNHEYFHGPGEAIAYIRQLGITPLLNEHVVIGKGKQQFNLVGINDVIGARSGLYPPDAKKAFSQADQNNTCIVLAHQPRMINELDDYRCDLVLSGHTHGGQIFPFGLLVMAAQPYLSGLHRHAENRYIYVSRGTGYWGPPIRFLAPSEISQILIES